MALTMEEQKLKDLKIKQMKATTSENPPKEEVIENNDTPPVEDDPVKRLQKLEKENEALKKRVGQMTAAIKGKQESAKKESEDNSIDAEKQELLNEYNKQMSERKKLKKKFKEAVQMGEDEKADDIEKKLEENLIIITKLDRMNDDLNKKKEKTKASKETEAVMQKWNSGYLRAAKYIERRSENQDIFTEEGQLNNKSEVLILAMELLDEDAEPAKKMKALGKDVNINPEYDHEDGVYLAIKDAFDILKAKGGLKKKKEPTSFKEKLGVEDEDDDASSDQPLTTDRSHSGGTGGELTKTKIEKLKADAFKNGPGSQQWREYYKAIRPNYNKPI